MSFCITLSLCLVLALLKAQLICEEGYTCYEDSESNIVWVKRDEGNIYGPTCQAVCQDALLNNVGIFHSCDGTQPVFYDIDSFADIATGLGFTCKKGNCDNISHDHLIYVTRGDDADKNCYFPTEEANVDKLLSCTSVPGNSNCYAERFSIICPCMQKPLDEACIWSNPPNTPSIPNWNNANEDSTSCIDRVNYWRQRACNEQWIECPPSGLPPMTECTCCHQCANSQSEYDKANGAHKSFKRCGDSSQGSGGGSSCAAVIDAFISERKEDENGIMRCEGHCGPIVGRGCETFFWGEFDGFYTLNWGNCNTEKCNAYCDDPTDNACFSSPSDIAPDISQCDGIAFTDNSSGKVSTIVGISVFTVLIFVIGGLLLWKKRNENLKTKVDKQINDEKMNETTSNGNTL